MAWASGRTMSSGTFWPGVMKASGSPYLPCRVSRCSKEDPAASGTAEFEGVRLPVVSDGEFVPPGTAVQVVTVQGNQIVVRPEEG